MRKTSFALVTILTVEGSMACSSAEPAPPTPPAASPPGTESVNGENDGLSPDAAPKGPPFELSFPRVENAGGPVIKKARVLPIVFKGDPLIPSITKFTEKMASSSYFAAAGKEYGVGAMTAAAPIVVETPPAAAITSEGIEEWLIAQLSGTTPAFGAPDENTLYALFYPPGVKITSGEGVSGQSCEGYGGFHAEVAAAGQRVGYTVLPRCAGIDDLTVSASHEIFEWATDPFPMTAPAYAIVDDAHWVFQATMFGELSDLCTFLDREMIRPTDLGFDVQRHWSNAASAKGVFPCAPDGVRRKYFQAIPHLVDEVDAFDYRSRETLQFVRAKAMKLAPGEVRSIDVYMHATEPLSGIDLKAITFDEAYQRPSTSGFEISLSQPTANSGDIVQLKVTAPKKASTDFVFLYSKKDDGIFLWPMVVTTEKQIFPPGATFAEGITRLKPNLSARARTPF